jgi:hypothetical protein
VNRDALDGLQILLIVIPRLSNHRVHFIAGRATVRDDSISLYGPQGEHVITVDAAAAALRGFDVEMLSKVMLPECLPLLGNLIDDIEACVAVFSNSVPSDSLVIEYPFYALGQGADGEPLLFQGDSEPPEFEDDAEAPPPWAAPPWTPDDGWEKDDHEDR